VRNLPHQERQPRLPEAARVYLPDASPHLIDTAAKCRLRRSGWIVNRKAARGRRGGMQPRRPCRSWRRRRCSRFAYFTPVCGGGQVLPGSHRYSCGVLHASDLV
jgi:hypothetical protein